MATKPAGVRTTNPDHDELMPQWQRCSDVVDGQDEIHKAGEKYLPKLTDEETAEYFARLKRSDFFNATWRTIAGMAGMAFRKPPVVEVPAAIEPMLTDIDMAGKAIDKLAKGLVEDMLEYGCFGLMVDHPSRPEGVKAITQAVAEQMGLRPVIRYYEIESVINWRYKRINNRWQLALVVLKESAEVGDDEFSHKADDRYRVLDLIQNAQGAWTYRQREFRINDKGEDEQVGSDMFPLLDGKPLSEIPFKIVGAMEEPPLIDLVDANIAHYQINSDYRHGLHFTGLPTAVVAGYQKTEGEKLYIGSTSAWIFPDPQAKASFLEFTGQGLSETREALRALEQRMAVLGARMIADETTQAETLGGTQIKRAGENSILASIVLEVSDALGWALTIFAAWAGSPGEVKYQINRDFNPAGLDAQQLTALVGAVQAGQVSEAEFFDLLQRHDVVDAGKTFEEHQAETEMQGPSRPVVGVTEVAA